MGAAARIGIAALHRSPFADLAALVGGIVTAVTLAVGALQRSAEPTLAETPGVQPLPIRALRADPRPPPADPTPRRAAPPIPGLTDAVVDLDETDWRLLLRRLERARLVRLSPDAEGAPGLDAHPLIRDYFAEQLRRDRPAAYRSAHGRLFEHLCTSTFDLRARGRLNEALTPMRDSAEIAFRMKQLLASVRPRRRTPPDRGPRLPPPPRRARRRRGGNPGPAGVTPTRAGLASGLRSRSSRPGPG